MRAALLLIVSIAASSCTNVNADDANKQYHSYDESYHGNMVCRQVYKKGFYVYECQSDTHVCIMFSKSLSCFSKENK